MENSSENSLKKIDYTNVEENDEISLVELIAPIIKNKNFIIKWTVYAFFLSVLISLILPKKYLSYAKIIPPQPYSLASQQVLTQFSTLTGVPVPGSSIKDTLALYAELLKTNTVVDYVADNNNLASIYKIKLKPYLRKRIVDSLYIETDRKSGIMTVGYIDKDPQLSYKVVLSFIEGLKKLNNQLAITEAAQRRLFYEEQLKIAKENLINSEEEMKRFQLKTGSIKIDEEAKAAIEEISLLRARISSKEVQLRVLERYATNQSPEYKTLLDEITALKEQLSKLQSKTPSEDEAMLSTKRASVYGIEYIRKVREFKYNEALYDILLKQYEAARLDESKDSTVIQLVEKPEVPVIKYKPKRRVFVIQFTLITFFILIFFVFIKNAFEKLKNNSPYTKDIKELEGHFNLNDVLNEMKSDLNKIKTLILENKKS